MVLSQFGDTEAIEARKQWTTMMDYPVIDFERFPVLIAAWSISSKIEIGLTWDFSKFRYCDERSYVAQRAG